jgi:hypothetical protein
MYARMGVSVGECESIRAYVCDHVREYMCKCVCVCVCVR